MGVRYVRVLVVLVSVFSWLGSGCGSDTHCGDGELAVGKQCVRMCYGHDECRSGYDCASGVCALCLDNDDDDVCDRLDVCPDVIDSTQDDADADGIGDACDGCPLDVDNDGDSDGVCAAMDNCATVANADQLDTDGDQTGDACDGCPLDADNDADGDGYCHNDDNCPAIASEDRTDSDGDGVGDLCDRCPGFDDLIDSDGDGLPNDCEPKLIYDLDAAPDATGFKSIAKLGNVALLIADDGLHGGEPWRSDGTSAGTFMLRDINPFGDSSITMAAEVLNGIAYFIATDGEDTGSQLWRTDGSIAGTWRVTNGKAPGPLSIKQVWAAATKLFLAASDAEHGDALWQSDGTAAGTTFIADLVPGAQSLSLSSVVTLGDSLYFAVTLPAEVACANTVLWRTTGTAAETTCLAPEASVAAALTKVTNLRAIGSTLYFSGTDPAHGEELWMVASEGALPTLVIDIVTGTGSSEPYPVQALGNKLCFAAKKSATGLHYLWLSDGTAGNTALISADVEVAPTSYVVVSDRIYFQGWGTTGGWKPFVSDGTESGTKLLFTDGTNITVDSPVPFGAGVALLAYESTGNFLWQTMGTPATTTRLLSSPDNLRTPSILSSFGTSLLFAADDPELGKTLWRVTAGSTTATLVIDIAATTRSSTIQNVAGPVGDLVCVQVKPNSSTPRTHCTHSAGAGWTVAVTGAEAPLSANIFGAAGETLWLVDNTQIWSTDGRTAAATFVVDALPAAVVSSTAVTSGSSLYRAAIVEDTATASAVVLYRFDPTGLTEVCRRAFDFANPYWSPSVSLLTAHDSLYFTAFIDPPTTDASLRRWRYNPATGDCDTGTALAATTTTALTDGDLIYATDGNTILWFDGVADTRVALDSLGLSNIGNLTPFLSAVYFTATDSSADVELWRTRGTAATTERVLEINPTGSSTPHELLVASNALYFMANDGVHGRQLWRTDGTTTRAVTSFARSDAWPDAATPRTLAAVGSLVFFAANDGLVGMELWRTDGTAAGTYVEADINPGSPSSSPSSFYTVGEVLVFSANDSQHGVEPFMFRVPAGGSSAP